MSPNQLRSDLVHLKSYLVGGFGRLTPSQKLIGHGILTSSSYTSNDCSGDKIPNSSYGPEQAFGEAGLWGGRKDNNVNFWLGMT